MTTVEALFAAGDASGASSHKFSSGSHAEGRIAGKAAIKYIVEKGADPKLDAGKVDELKSKILAPLDRYQQHCKETTAPEVNPNYIMWLQFMHRLQKIMDEYAGGVTAAFKTSKPLLDWHWNSSSILRKTLKNWLQPISMTWKGAGKTSTGCGRQRHISGPSFSVRRQGGPGIISGLIPPRWIMIIGCAL